MDIESESDIDSEPETMSYELQMYRSINPALYRGYDSKPCSPRCRRTDDHAPYPLRMSGMMPTGNDREQRQVSNEMPSPPAEAASRAQRVPLPRRRGRRRGRR